MTSRLQACERRRGAVSGDPALMMDRADHSDQPDVVFLSFIHLALIWDALQLL